MASEYPDAGDFSSRKVRQPPTLDLTAREVPATADTGVSADPNTAERTEQAAPHPEQHAEAHIENAHAEVTGSTPSNEEVPPPFRESTATPASAPEPTPAPKRAGLGIGGFVLALIAGAVAGGATGGGVVYSLATQGAFATPAPDLTSDLAPLTARLAQLEARPAGDPQALATLRENLQTADQRLAGVARSMEQLAARPAAPEGATPEEIAAALAQARGQDEAQTTALKEQLTAAQDLLSRLAATQQTLEQQVGTATQSASKALEQAQAISGQAETAVREAQSAARQAGDISPRIDTLAQTAANALALAQQSETLAPRLDVLAGSLTEARAEAQALVPRIAAMGARLESERKAMQARIAETDSFSRTAAAMVVMADLQDAVRSGRPFATELAAARALLGTRASVLDPLAIASSKGYAPRGRLAEQLEREGTAAIAGLNPPAPKAQDDSIVSRFLSSAESLVTIRPAGGPDTAGAQGALARAVALVRSGDLDGAQREIQSLPPQVSEKLAAISADIEARRQAVQLVSSLYRQSLAAISGKTP